MAYISHSSPARLFITSSNLAASVLATISTWFNRLKAWQQIRAMEKALAAAPFDMRKDLGWPAHDTWQTRRDIV